MLITTALLNLGIPRDTPNMSPLLVCRRSPNLRTGLTHWISVLLSMPSSGPFDGGVGLIVKSYVMAASPKNI